MATASFEQRYTPFIILALVAALVLVSGLVGDRARGGRQNRDSRPGNGGGAVSVENGYHLAEKFSRPGFRG